MRWHTLWRNWKEFDVMVKLRLWLRRPRAQVTSMVPTLGVHEGRHLQPRQFYQRFLLLQVVTWELHNKILFGIAREPHLRQASCHLLIAVFTIKDNLGIWGEIVLTHTCLTPCNSTLEYEYPWATIIMEIDIHKAGEEGINEVVESRKIVMQVEE